MKRVVRSLRHGNFQLYFWGQLVSMIGTWMQTMAQMWLVYRLTHSTWLLGLVGFVSQAPVLVIGVFGGVVADRFDRRAVALWTQGASLVQALALGLLTVSGRITVPEVFALSAFMGVINVFDLPARQALVVELVAREDLGNAIALNTFMVNASRMIGPAIAGFLVAWVGEGPVFLINAASYVASVATLTWLALPPRPAARAGGLAEALLDVREGVRYAFSDRQMSAMLSLLAALSLFGVPVMALLPVFAEDILHAGPSGVGWLMAATGVGAIVGSWFLALRSGVDGLAGAIGASAAAFGLAVAAFACSRSFAFSMLAMTLTGWGMMTAFVGCNTLLQHLTSDHMRGRVMSLFSMTFMGVAPVGNLAFGAIAERVGAPWTVAVGGAICVGASAWFLRGARRLAAPALCALLLLESGTARAQMGPVPPERPVVRSLTWDDCVEAALRGNPDLASASKASEASRASYYQSFNGLLPSLTLSNGWSTSSSARGSPSYSASGTAGLDLFNAGTIASIRSSRASLSQSEAALRSASSSLRLSLRRAFAQTLSAEKSVEVSRLILAMREKDAQLVTLRYQSGHEYKGNMLNAKAQLLQAKASLARSLRDLDTARRSLDRQLGFDAFEQVAATGTLAAAPPPELPARLDELVDARPDVAQQRAAVRGAEASVASSESSLWPSLSGSYSRTRSDSVEFPSRNYSWSAGATLSYPLFGGGPTSTLFGVKSAKRSLERAREDLRATRDSALVDLESSWASYASAVDQVQVQDALLEAARQRNAEADIRYASGLLNFDNWELIVSGRVSAEQSAIQTRLNAVVAQAAWERALGKALGE